MKPIIERRDGKRVYDFTKNAEAAPVRDDEERRTIDLAIAIIPDQLAPDRLIWARDLIERSMKILDLQIAAIRRKLSDEGERPENARWWSKATAAERIKSQHRVRLQTKFGDVHRLIRTQNRIQSDLKQKTKDHRFIELAKEHLSRETYLAIWQKVEAEFAENDR